MFPAFSLKVESAAIADFVRSVHDPLDVVTIAARLRHGTRTLLAARGESRGETAVFFIDETEDAGRVYGCIEDRLLLEFTRMDYNFRSWRTLWLFRHRTIRLSVVALTLLPVRPL